MTGRDAGTRCSQLLGVRSRNAALQLDLACSMRLVEFENKRTITFLKGFKAMFIEAVAEVLGAKPADTENDDDDPEFEDKDVL